MRRIGVLTSGGDSPGMNAAVMAVAKAARYHGMSLIGIKRGYNGTLCRSHHVEDDMVELDLDTILDIADQPGTYLRTARCLDFLRPEMRAHAVSNIHEMGIEGIVVIGGDGSYHGAMELCDLGIPCVGIPGTIDNDLAYTEMTLGYDTAVNSCVDDIRAIRATSRSHDRPAVVEVMGRHCGDIALKAAAGSGAEICIVPEVSWSIQEVADRLARLIDVGNPRATVVVAEGAWDSMQPMDWHRYLRENGVRVHDDDPITTAMLAKILKVSEEKKAMFSCIHDIRDESDRSGLRAVIEIKKDFDAEKILQKLYKYSDLQVTYGVNMVAIKDGKPMQLGLIPLLDAFIDHQKNVVTRRSQYDLDQAKARAHIVEGLIRAVDVLDEIIKTIRASKNGKEARERLCAQFGFTELQAQAILDLRLQRLTGLEILALQNEFEQLKKTIAELEGILGSEKKLLKVIKKELSEIGQQFGGDRRTTILEEEAAASPAEEEEIDLPVPEDCVVLYTRGGQLRRMLPRIFEKIDISTQEADMPRFLLRTQTDHTLLFFTNRGQCYMLPVTTIADSIRPKERGVALTGILGGFEADETCVQILDIAPGAFDHLPDILFFTQNGLIKRSPAKEYAVRRSRFAALSLKEGDAVVAVAYCQERGDAVIVTRGGMSIRFTLDSVPAQGRASGGVKGIALADGDQVILGATLQNSDQLLLFTECGYAKRVPGAMLDQQGRGGKGARIMPFNKNGSTGSYVAACKKLTGIRDFTVSQKNGMLTPMNSEAIAPQAMSDKGKTAVIALMDDVVTDVIMW